VIVAFPAATPVTTPEEALTVATLVLELDQVPPLTVELNVVVPPIQALVVPERVPAEPALLIVTCAVAVAVEEEQGAVPVTVYVIVAFPAATPVTTPEEALTVATLVLELDQVPPLTVELNVEVPLTQKLVVPLMVPAVGGALTVTVRVAVALAQPPVPVTV
jgi:hypothetical protein